MSLRHAIGCMSAACLVAGAQAHAFLDHAEPRVGTTVAAAPVELKLWFTEKLEPAFSTVKVLGADGKQVDRGDARVDGERRDLLRVSLSALRPGAYTVVWRVVSVDTHVSQGDFAFRVGQ